MFSRLKQRMKWLLKVAVIAVPLLFIVSFIFIEYSSRPEFCKSCHFMQIYYDSWKTSKHNNVKCSECHYPPGAEGFIVSKTQALSSVVTYFTKTHGTKPWAEIGDKSCLKQGCHSKQIIKGKRVFKGVVFDHGSHLTQLRRGKQLRCVSCHSQIVQGEHITATVSTCFLCHFKDLPESRPISGCSSCHGPPMATVEFRGVKFDHKDELERGVECEKCHIDVTEGDGAVPQERCLGCHIEPDRLAQFDNPELLHQKHITEHKVECTQCHLEIQHKIKTLMEPLAIECQTCHPDHHAAQRGLYMGVGGKDVSPKPGPMFLSRVSCEGCHIGHKGSEIEGMTHIAKEAACMNCHGTNYAHLQDEWIQGMGNLINQLQPAVKLVTAEISRTDKAGEAKNKAQELYSNATHNIELVRYGRGVHNIEYSDQLLLTAHDNLAKALKLLDSKHTIPPLRKPIVGEGSACLNCHLGIENNTVSRTKGQDWKGDFPHFAHVINASLSCSTCHSDAEKPNPEHGKTLASAMNCVQCHHKKTDCQNCHKQPLKQVTYQQKPFNHELHTDKIPPSPLSQRGGECAVCHAANIKRNFKGECVSCHHDEKRVAVEGKCAACHPIQTAMYQGTKHNLPSVKFEAEIDCVDCHQLETETVGKVTRAACNYCHDEDDYGTVMDTMQTQTKKTLASTYALAQKAEKLLMTLNVPEAKQLYKTAKADLDFVKSDNSLSIHNPELADVLVKQAEKKLQECLRLLAKSIQ